MGVAMMVFLILCQFLYSWSSALIFLHDCTTFIAPVNIGRGMGVGRYLNTQGIANRHEITWQPGPAVTTRTFLRIQLHCWCWSQAGNIRGNSKWVCVLYNWKGKEWRRNSQEVGREQSHSLSAVFLGEINEKPHRAYTSAGNSQKEDTSSRWAVKLSQIK